MMFTIMIACTLMTISQITIRRPIVEKLKDHHKIVTNSS